MGNALNIGIDVSMNSTGVCIQFLEETYFLSFAANLTDRKINNSVTVVYKDLLPFDNFELIRLNREHLNLSKKEKKNYSFSEKIKLQDAIHTADLIYTHINNLKLELSNKAKVDSINIAMEGFSYGSRGSSKNDISGLTYIIRERLLKISDNIYFYSPKAIKKFAGKKLEAKTGNAGKTDMFDMFVNNSLDDKNLKTTKMYQFIKNNQDVCIRKNKILKPLDDLIDSYFVCRKVSSKK